LIVVFAHEFPSFAARFPASCITYCDAARKLCVAVYCPIHAVNSKAFDDCNATAGSDDQGAASAISICGFSVVSRLPRVIGPTSF
jgi:hypothetical protein